MPAPLTHLEQWLKSTDEPGIVTWNTPRDRAAEYAREWQSKVIPTSVLRGTHMRESEPLFEEFAASIRYRLRPVSAHWNAFTEWMGESEYVESVHGMALVILDSDEVLADDEPGGPAALTIRLMHAYEKYASSIEFGNIHDRGPIPFHVILQHDNKDMSAWLDAGAAVLTE